jgi:uncharacterized protein (UPF0276 family)
VPDAIGFFELAPENWAGMGGARPASCAPSPNAIPSSATACRCRWAAAAARCGSAPAHPRLHGQHGIGLYTEHLSWSNDAGQLYDLLPLPCTGEAVRWTAARIRQAQDVLGMRIGIENASRYVAPPGPR